jgi:hypothetical protein
MGYSRNTATGASPGAAPAASPETDNPIESNSPATGLTTICHATYLFNVPITFNGSSNVSAGPIFGNGTPGFVGSLIGAASSATNAQNLSSPGTVGGTNIAAFIGAVGTGTATNLAAAVGTIGGTNVTTAITNDANLRGVQVAQLSVIGGGNELTDMFTATNAFDGQLAVAESGGASGVGLYASRGGPGTGTNVFGFPIDLLGGVDYLGNPFWYDMPKSGNLTSLQISWGYGPTASRLTSAYVGGNTNGSTIQPVLNIYDANPFNGGGGFNITGAFTNSSLGNPIIQHCCALCTTPEDGHTGGLG